MSKRIYLSLGVIALLLALLWWFWPRQAMPSAAREQPAKPATAAAPASSPTPGTPQKDGITAEDLARIPGPGTDEQKRARILEVRQIMNQANQPVNFWGKVIDQDNAPLPGVKVKVSVKHTRELLPGATRDVFDYLDLVTDAEGLFNVTDRKGSLLGIEEMKKDGYESPNTGGRAYWYAPPVVTMQYTPDRSKPEVFKMWKKSGAEKLVHKSPGVSIPYDGTPVNFDLLNGREVPSGGDVSVILVRTPRDIQAGQKYDWTATIEAVDGGVIASTDEFMYRAPESGYEPKLTISVSAQDPKWSAQRTVAFYLKSHGRYSRVKARFTTDYDRPKTGFGIEAYTNPTGSRNLEYDPMQDVAPLPTTPVRQP